jgi:hypothetical protein
MELDDKVNMFKPSAFSHRARHEYAVSRAPIVMIPMGIRITRRTRLKWRVMWVRAVCLDVWDFIRKAWS